MGTPLIDAYAEAESASATVYPFAIIALVTLLSLDMSSLILAAVSNRLAPDRRSVLYPNLTILLSTSLPTAAVPPTKYIFLGLNLFSSSSTAWFMFDE